MNNIQIIKFKPEYRDDMIFMILEGKDALGRVPGMNEDLLDVSRNYFEKGDMFWIAIDENNRVVGSVGYSSIDETTEVWLHRLFVKKEIKHQGIGTKLLLTAENYLKENGKSAIRVHLGNPQQWCESYNFYRKYGYLFYEECYAIKEL